MYKRKDHKKITIQEFCTEIDFKFGIPLITLDIIEALTGYDMIAEVRKLVDPPKYIERLNPDCLKFAKLKD